MRQPYVAWLLAALCCGGTLLAEGPAEARRVALVIGNADYKVGPLQNPVNDATSVAKAFEAMRFDKVLLRQNLGMEGFRAALIDMSREAANADLGVVYFAGHGVEVGGRNYLIPVDAALARQGDLDLQAIALDTVIAQLAGVTNLKLVILDACRSNVFPLAGSTRSIGRGLSPVIPEDNTLVVYASKDGTTAEDGTGRQHSPFTEALLKHIGTPNVEVRLLFGLVRDDVMELTRHDAQPQQPYLYGTLGGRTHYLQPVDPGNDTPEAQRLREQERELARALAATKAAQEQRREIERRLETERKAKARVIEEAKRGQPATRPAINGTAAAAAPAGATCSDVRELCTQECTSKGTLFSQCDNSCRARFRACLRTGSFSHGLNKQ